MASSTSSANPIRFDAPTTIGIDVGGTKILGVVIEGSKVVAKNLNPTPKDPTKVAAAIGDAVSDLLDEFGAVGGVGVGLPGLVDYGGVLQYGPNVPGVVGLNIVDYLKQGLGLEAVASNDASCAALAEHRLGAARGYEHAVIVTQGTGIGGGLIVNNGILRGANGFAGEPGHMLIDRRGEMCACGTRGCWEAVASGAGLANIARSLVEEGRAETILGFADGISDHIRGEHVAQALQGGDADAREVVKRFSWWVAQGLASLITLLDPGVVVLGGGLTALSDQFIPDIQRQVASSVMGGAHRPEVPVVAAELGPEAGAVGAALLAQQDSYPRSVDTV